ncbi:MAG: AAA family ATPase [Nanoarchaeota archaeon]
MITLKYKPNSCKEILGQSAALAKLANFIKIKNKAVLVYGPTGSGKTSAVHALANDLNYEILEVNASDIRNKDAITKIVGEFGKQHSLFCTGKIILIDEVEGISGRYDRGGLQALMSLIDEISFPVIMTTTNIESEKIESMKSKCNLVEFSPVSVVEIHSLLSSIVNKENISASSSLLRDIAVNSCGDVRAAMLDLEILSVDGRLEERFFNVLGRARREAIHDILIKILKGKDLVLAEESLQNSDFDLVDLSGRKVYPVLFSKESCVRFLLEENIPYEYDSLDGAFDCLSKSDVFHGRIGRWQYYRFLVYVQSMLASVCLMKNSKNPNPVSVRGSFRSPKHNRKLWFIMNKRKFLVSEKIAAVTNSSVKRTNRDMFFYKIILKNYINNFVVKEFDFDDKDVEWIKK